MAIVMSWATDGWNGMRNRYAGELVWNTITFLVKKEEKTKTPELNWRRVVSQI